MGTQIKKSIYIYMHFHRRKSAYGMENQGLFQGIGTRYLVCGIDAMYLVQGIGPKWFWSKVLTKGLKLYKEEKIIRPSVQAIRL